MMSSVSAAVRRCRTAYQSSGRAFQGGWQIVVDSIQQCLHALVLICAAGTSELAHTAA